MMGKYKIPLETLESTKRIKIEGRDALLVTLSRIERKIEIASEEIEGLTVTIMAIRHLGGE